jgi:hypothetical protein
MANLPRILGMAIAASGLGLLGGLLVLPVGLLKPIFLATELAALGLWAVRVSPVGRGLARLLETNLTLLVVCVVILAACALVAANRSRVGQRVSVAVNRARWCRCPSASRRAARSGASLVSITPRQFWVFYSLQCQ